jgi:hypothetical protein
MEFLRKFDPTIGVQASACAGDEDVVVPAENEQAYEHRGEQTREFAREQPVDSRHKPLEDNALPRGREQRENFVRTANAERHASPKRQRGSPRHCQTQAKA